MKVSVTKKKLPRAKYSYSCMKISYSCMDISESMHENFTIFSCMIFFVRSEAHKAVAYPQT